jgi:hypothetical protein
VKDESLANKASHDEEIEIERLTLRGKIAKIAIAVTPLMGYLPDVSALIKYVLVMMAVGVSLTDDQMVSCKQVNELSATRTLISALHLSCTYTTCLSILSFFALLCLLPCSSTV